MIFADIIVDISHEDLDRSFQYIIPKELEEKIYVGVLVKIPFGRGNRIISGYVVGITKKPAWEISKMKKILEIEEQKVPVETELIALAGFIRENYGATMNQALKTVIPVRQKTKAVENKMILLAEDYKDSEKFSELLALCEKKHALARLRLLKEFLQKKELDYSYAVNILKVSAASVKELEKQGVIKVDRQTVYRNPLTFLEDFDRQPAVETELELNEEQKKIVEDIGKSEKRVHLIYGITGSGKTRVYIELIKETIRAGKQAIVMIPEISLTYQTVKRFSDVFGSRVSIINSKLSAGERYDQFERAKKGEIDIMIGPRSALFTPFSKTGIIIIDEEHESSYKSETVPKYHARETAVYRAKLCGAKLVLGSATPSVAAYYRALQGEYVLHKLEKRAAGQIAKVSVVDLRRELSEGNKTIFSRRLNNLILDRLEKKEQIMLFINRRGYAGFVSCRSCGEAIKCPHCDVSLTYHSKKNSIKENSIKENSIKENSAEGNLICHYCGYTLPMPKYCPNCASPYIAGFGTGTQKVEEQVKKYYPNARVLRMDTDTTSTKGGHERIIRAFAEHKADILIGTQMIVKGHDFPLVTLVGIIAADLSLYAPDYRASERTFQLLTQAEGRAGRHERYGEAVIQTYQPENASIVSAAAQNYEQFYEKEILYRTIMEYPPVIHMMAILITSKKKEDGAVLCEKIKKIIEEEKESYRIIGPAQANIFKIKDIYRRVIYIKHAQKEKIISLKNTIEEKIKAEVKLRKADILFDLNPMNGY